eukprot:95422_1
MAWFKKHSKSDKIPKSFETGDLVQLNKKKQGRIRFIGQLHNRDGVWYGIELTSKHKGENNGNIGSQQYFECEEAGKGIFVKPKQLQSILEKVKKKTDPEKEDISQPIPATVVKGNETNDVDDREMERHQVESYAKSENESIEEKRNRIKEELNNLRPIDLMEKLNEYILDNDFDLEQIEML